MAVSDRWHKSRPAPGEALCREHKLVPSAAHGKGERWQVRYRDRDGRQQAKSFALKTGKNPEIHADAFDRKVGRDLDTGNYVDPSRADITFREYAEDWRQGRSHDIVTADRIERNLRRHAYPVIGGRRMRELEQRPSLTSAWIAGMKLAESSKLQVVKDVSQVYVAAIDDGVISRNPTLAKSVSRPRPDRKRARPWTLDQVEALSDGLPGRYAIVPYLAAGTGMRQGECFGLAVEDVAFLGRKPMIHVVRQVRLIGSDLVFRQVKNDREHDVPLAASLAPRLARHMELYPPAAVTLPWNTPDGDPVTFRLILTTPAGGALNRTRFNESQWWPAQVKAGIIPAREPGQRRRPARDEGMHRGRHTAASAWLSAGVDIVTVAEWLGDTVKVVADTYAHMMPDADDRGRAAMDLFFTRDAACAPDVHAGGVR